MTTATVAPPRHGNAYNIFILVLTVYSLVIMVLLFLPLPSATLDLLTFYDNLICVIFLTDFFLNLKQAPSKRGYFIGERGWLDLLGSVPSLGILRATAILRLARLSRFARITRLLRGQNQKQLVDDVVRHRAHYAVGITILLAILVLVTSSIIVLNAETRSDTANIKTGGDAFWWAFVTITTVGYGDRFPTTTIGRLGGMFVMAMGIGIIGALASIMASILVGSEPSDEDGEAGAKPSGDELAGLRQELAGVRSEMAALRRLVERIDERSNRIESSSE
jgi:voltage-gated potassium channel